MAGDCRGRRILRGETEMIAIPGSLTGGGGLSVSQNPVSGTRDNVNDSGSGAAEGLSGSIVNNLSFGSSRLSSKLSADSESSVLIWIAVGAAALFGLWWWKNRK